MAIPHFPTSPYALPLFAAKRAGGFCAAVEVRI